MLYLGKYMLLKTKNINDLHLAEIVRTSDTDNLYRYENDCISEEIQKLKEDEKLVFVEVQVTALHAYEAEIVKHMKQLW